jgi:hypothetical protein
LTVAGLALEHLDLAVDADRRLRVRRQGSVDAPRAAAMEQAIETGYA